MQWWSAFPTLFRELSISWFISALVKWGILSNEFPQPSLGYFGAGDSGEQLVGSFESRFFRLVYILSGSGSTTTLSLPDLIYSWTLWSKQKLLMQEFCGHISKQWHTLTILRGMLSSWALKRIPRHLNQNFSSSFFRDEGFLPAKEALGMSFSVRETLLSLTRRRHLFFVVYNAEAFPASLPCYQVQVAPRGGHLWIWCMMMQGTKINVVEWELVLAAMVCTY